VNTMAISVANINVCAVSNWMVFKQLACTVSMKSVVWKKMCYNKFLLCCIIVHHVSKKLCQLVFCSVLFKYESISITIGRHVLEETTNKTVQPVPTSHIMCASTTLENLKWHIELSVQYLHVDFSESLNSHKSTDSYCLENRQTCS